MRYTRNSLQHMLNAINAVWPLATDNGYGNRDRFGIQSAYGYHRVVEYLPGTTGQRDTHVHGGTSRECAEALMDWLLVYDWEGKGMDSDVLVDVVTTAAAYMPR